MVKCPCGGVFDERVKVNGYINSIPVRVLVGKNFLRCSACGKLLLPGELDIEMEE